jgi:hypothetical protein
VSGTSSRVFISYARADIGYLEQFCTHVADLRHQGVEFLYDHTIPPGSDFERTLYDYLDQADVVLLLLTQNYIRRRGMLARHRLQRGSRPCHLPGCTGTTARRRYHLYCV